MSLSLNTLDITGFRQKGQELHMAIVAECRRIDKTSNLGFSMSQYNIIKMTQSQYDGLNKLSGNVVDQFHDDNMMYKTPYNIMEIRVPNRTRLTFKEAHSLDDKAFVDWEDSVTRGSE